MSGAWNNMQDIVNMVSGGETKTLNDNKGEEEEEKHETPEWGKEATS